MQMQLDKVASVWAKVSSLSGWRYSISHFPSLTVSVSGSGVPREMVSLHISVPILYP